LSRDVEPAVANRVYDQPNGALSAPIQTLISVIDDQRIVEQQSTRPVFSDYQLLVRTHDHTDLLKLSLGVNSDAEAVCWTTVRCKTRDVVPQNSGAGPIPSKGCLEPVLEDIFTRVVRFDVERAFLHARNSDKKRVADSVLRRWNQANVAASRSADPVR
jgi:hypothetical protein